MSDRLDEVHYCKCGHMLTNHHYESFTDDNGVRINFYPCNYHTCNCLQYEKKFTLYYKEIFQVDTVLGCQSCAIGIKCDDVACPNKIGT